MEYHPLDNSALIHLAVAGPHHSNLFRLEAHLRSGIQPAKLQRAVDRTAARFPMLAAAVRKQGNEFVVVPAPERLYIRVDQSLLATMSAEERRDCALRVLYGQHHIAVEFFHALTDGAGGLQFLRALLADYLDAPADPAPGREAWEDSYKRYASGVPTAMPGGHSYLLPAAPLEGRAICRTTLAFPADALRARAREMNTTLTALFTTLFAQTAMELQQANSPAGAPLLPVQIMVPINLRKRFPSASLRNFSLYALPRLTPEAAGAPFSAVAENLSAQLQAQCAYSRLRDAMATNAALEQTAAPLPLWMKCAFLRAGFEVCGGRSSCITVSNLGPVGFPDAVQQELTRLDFMLTPRAHSPYNCGIVSTGGTLRLTITRRGRDHGVEKAFLRRCAALGLPALPV